MKFKYFYEQNNIESDIQESINDKNLLKAVIMAGSPGSGKSFISRKLFANVKSVNSDKFLEYILKKNKMSLVLDPLNADPDQAAARERAKELADKSRGHYMNGLLPMVVDGTGKDFDKIKTQKQFLESNGYDVSMVFVNADLNTALKRNAKRERKVSDAFVQKAWEAIQSNMGKFQSLFGNDMFIIDNSENSELDDRLFNKIFTATIESPLKNRIGIELLRDIRSKSDNYKGELR